MRGNWGGVEEVGDGVTPDSPSKIGIFDLFRVINLTLKTGSALHYCELLCKSILAPPALLSVARLSIKTSLPVCRGIRFPCLQEIDNIQMDRHSDNY